MLELAYLTVPYVIM